MGQEFHRFRAPSLDEAYNLMRDRLGDLAIVVRTTQVKEGGVLGLFGKRVVELTATAPAPAAASARKPSAVEKRYAGASRQARERATPTEVPRQTAVGSDETVKDSVAYFQQLVSDAQKRIGVRRPVELATGHGPESLAPVIPFPRPGRDTPSSDAVRSELKELRELVEVLVAETPGAGIPSECAPLYKRLIDSGVSRKAAAALMASAVRGSDLELLRNPSVLEQRISFEIRKQVKTSGGIGLCAGTCRTIALVGATGVGKTTSLAKLAARFAVRERARVALVTADTYRVAAPEQLRVYANIIGIPLHVVNDAAEMRATLRKLRDYDLVLVDTAGGSQFNKGQLRELRDILDAAQPDETMLVLGANTQLDDLRQIVQNFAPLRPTSLFFSKLDETRRYGGLYTTLAETGLPLGYFSVGQNVPDDLILAQPEMVADLLLSGKATQLSASKQR
jgi:flagellar biosynthesis protein FlhF